MYLVLKHRRMLPKPEILVLALIGAQWGDLACLGRARAWSFGELVLGLQSSCQEARSLGFSL